MVSSYPLISKPSSHSTNPLVTVPNAPITTGLTVTFMIFFSSLARSMYLSLFSLPFIFTLASTGTAKSPNRQVIYCFVDYHQVWLSGWDLVICSYLKILKNFVCPILQDGFRIVHIPLVRMVKFKFLARFPGDHPAHPVVASLILRN